MKRVINYLACGGAIGIATILSLSGVLTLTVMGLFLFCALLVSARFFPKYWKMFWMTNMRILKLFN